MIGSRRATVHFPWGMNMRASLIVTFAVFAAVCTDSSAQRTQSERERQGNQDRAAMRQFPEVERSVRDVSPIIDRAARQEAERATGRATNGQHTVTSRDRPSTGRLASEAHNRGAIDVTTSNMPRDAARISREAGSGHVAIHERPARPAAGAQGPSADIHTTYRDGRQVNRTVQPPRATGEHIHVQPNYNSRLHEAARTPTPRTEGGVSSSRSSSSSSRSLSSSSRSSGGTARTAR
jgi:hypothetical protein